VVCRNSVIVLTLQSFYSVCETCGDGDLVVYINTDAEREVNVVHSSAEAGSS